MAHCPNRSHRPEETERSPRGEPATPLAGSRRQLMRAPDVKPGPKTAEERRVQEELKLTIVRSLQKALTLETAAAIAGISTDSIRRWQNADEEFARSCARARAKAEALPTEVVFSAIEGQDVESAKWWLERRSPRFRKDGPFVDESGTQRQRSVAFRRISQPEGADGIDRR